MKFSYDKEADVLYAFEGNAPSGVFDERSDGIWTRIDPNTGRSIGFMILDYMRRKKDGRNQRTRSRSMVNDIIEQEVEKLETRILDLEGQLLKIIKMLGISDTKDEAWQCLLAGDRWCSRCKENIHPGNLIDYGLCPHCYARLTTPPEDKRSERSEA